MIIVYILIKSTSVFFRYAIQNMCIVVFINITYKVCYIVATLMISQ